MKVAIYGRASTKGQDYSDLKREADKQGTQVVEVLPEKISRVSKH